MKATKNILIAGVAFVAFTLGIGCGNNSTTETNNGDTTIKDSTTLNDKSNAEEHNDAKFSSKSEKDADFVANAADISLIEISLGQLAESNATRSDIKELGSMMVRDHKKAYDDLKVLAAKKSITIPSAITESTQKDRDALAAKNGNDFEKNYCDKMVSGHKDAIAMFEKESKNAADPDIQVWATNTLPTLRNHLDHAMNCQAKLKK